MTERWTPRPATPEEIPIAARLWREGWHETHAPLVPAELTALRTEESFADRLAAMGDRLRAAGPVGAPLGFCAIKPAEIDQLFVAPAARGTGVALALLTDAEARIAAEGHQVAVLDCAIGNERAARFYRKCGWRLRGEEVAHLDTSEGPFPMKTWVFEKRLA